MDNRKIVKGIVYFTLMFVMVMSGFVSSYKFVTDGVNSIDREMEIHINPEDGITVEIPSGSSTGKIAGILEANGLIKKPLLFKIMSNLNGFDGGYKSGAHIVSKDLDYTKLMIILSRNPEAVKVTIPEGNTVNQIAEALFKKKLIADKDSFKKAINNASFNFKFLEGLPKRENRLEGYLFPDTYEFGLKVKEEEIIKAMLNNFSDKFKPEYNEKLKELNKRYPKLNITMDNIITMASIIEREARIPEERARIAGVFYNRLAGRFGALKKLESCATIQYVYTHKETGISEENKNRIMKGIISDNDTKIDDPYNTYKYEGLPAGPICSPGKAAIEAALNPEDTRFLYFVVKKDGNGSHVFSETLAQHQNAVRENRIN